MRVTLPHNLTKEEVRRRMRTHADEIAGFFPPGLAKVTTGTVDVTVSRNGGKGRANCASVSRTACASTSSNNAAASGYARPKSCASMTISPPLGVMVAVACTCVTGTANAGWPYTTACSPQRMSLPGADANIKKRDWLFVIGYSSAFATNF